VSSQQQWGMTKSRADSLYAQIGQGVSGTLVTYDFSAGALGLTLLTNTVDKTVSLSGLLTTDRLLEIQPTAALPANVSVGYAFAPSDGNLTVRFTTPIALISNVNPSMRLTVFRLT
jgi:hypothetical protein